MGLIIYYFQPEFAEQLKNEDNVKSISELIKFCSSKLTAINDKVKNIEMDEVMKEITDEDVSK